MSDFFPNPDLFFTALGLAPEDLRPGHTVEIDGALLAQLISQALASAPVSTDSYLDRNPDIREAWESRQVKDLVRHYASQGFYERRIALPAAFDAEWYMNSYPDVQAAYDQGELTDASDHYLERGYLEWRAPSAATRETVQRWKTLLDE